MVLILLRPLGVLPAPLLPRLFPCWLTLSLFCPLLPLLPRLSFMPPPTSLAVLGIAAVTDPDTGTGAGAGAGLVLCAVCAYRNISTTGLMRCSAVNSAYSSAHCTAVVVRLRRWNGGGYADH